MVCAKVCYLDRTNISVAMSKMTEETGWSQTQQGMVLSSFFWGYIATQILAGKYVLAPCFATGVVVHFEL